jgi:hypothetical protein
LPIANAVFCYYVLFGKHSILVHHGDLAFYTIAAVAVLGIPVTFVALIFALKVNRALAIYAGAGLLASIGMVVFLVALMMQL